jgi:hypothetical protein
LGALTFGLLLPHFVLELFHIPVELQKLVVLVHLQGVSLPSQLVTVLDGLGCSSLGFVKVPTELLDEIAVSSVVATLVESLILKHQLSDLSLKAITNVSEFLLSLKFKAIKLCAKDVKLSFRLVKLVLKALIISQVLLKFNSVTSFKVFLNLHPEDISVDWQRKLLRHLVHFALL